MKSQNLDLSFDTRIGKATILKKGSRIPTGYRWVFPDECQWMKHELWQKVQKTFGLKKVALATGYFSNQSYLPVITYDGDNSDCELFLAISPDVSSFRIDNFTKASQLIKNSKFLLLPDGLIVRIGIKQRIPESFRKMTIQQGRKLKESLKQLLDYWSIVAFETGKIDGEGYGYTIQQSYGQQCGQVFITSIASF